MDILSRLPTKACLICKLVCKDWNSIIKDPLFPDSRLSRGCYSTLMLRVNFHNRRRNFLLLDIDKRPHVDEMGNLNLSPDVMIKFQTKLRVKNNSLSVVNECNGLILFQSSGDQGPYLICNLLTGQHVMIKKRRRPGYRSSSSGLGFCPVSKQFKILRILQVKEVYMAEIQTIGTNKWRPVVADKLPSDSWRMMDYTMIFFKSSLHCYSAEYHCIWSFHLGKEQNSCIPLPDGINKDTNNLNSHRYKSALSIFYSFLTVSSIIDQGSRCEIWIMKEYGVKESWMKLFVFQTLQPWRLILPMFQLDEDKVLVTSSYKNGLSVGGIQSGLFQEIKVLGNSEFYVLTYNSKFSKLQK